MLLFNPRATKDPSILFTNYQRENLEDSTERPRTFYYLFLGNSRLGYNGGLQCVYKLGEYIE